MKLTSFIFALFAFMLLTASISLAKGLEITEIDAYVDYDEAYTYRIEHVNRKNSASVPVSNNSKIDADILPGSNVTFTIRVENTFQGENPDLKGVFAMATIEDIDDGADLAEESIDFDLEPGNDERVDIKFEVPLDVEAGIYNVIIEADGEDRNGTQYSAEINLRLEVKKQSHDIRLTKVSLNPSIIDCDRKSKLTVQITNVGSNAEGQVALEFSSSDIGVSSIDKNIFLESSNEASDEEKVHTKTLNIDAPQSVKAGAYPIFINLYWKGIALFDQKIAELVVRDCGSALYEPENAQEGPGGENEAVTIIGPDDEKGATQKEGIQKEELIIATKETTVPNFILASLIFGGVMIIVLAVLAVIGYLRNKKESKLS
jgi:hypothetical protein